MQIRRNCLSKRNHPYKTNQLQQQLKLQSRKQRLHVSSTFHGSIHRFVSQHRTRERHVITITVQPYLFAYFVNWNYKENWRINRGATWGLVLEGWIDVTGSREDRFVYRGLSSVGMKSKEFRVSSEMAEKIFARDSSRDILSFPFRSRRVAWFLQGNTCPRWHTTPLDITSPITREFFLDNEAQLRWTAFLFFLVELRIAGYPATFLREVCLEYGIETTGCHAGIHAVDITTAANYFFHRVAVTLATARGRVKTG